ATWSVATDTFQSELDSGELEHTVMDGVLNMVGINFDTTKVPFDDPDVRRAINYAIERDAIVEAIKPDADVRLQPWPKGLPGFEAPREDTYSYDPEKAKKLLTDAGYEDDIDAGYMLVTNDSGVPGAGEVIQSNLA